MEQPFDLTIIWAGIIGFGIMMYVLMDGFDLGQGIDSAMLLLRLANSISDRVYFPLEGFLGSHFGCDCGRMTIVRAALF